MPCLLTFKAVTARLHRLLGAKKSATPKRQSLQISAPFNFKHESVSLPGVSEDEIAMLKEKARATRLGVATDGSSSFGNPRKAPAPPSPMRPVTPVVQIIPSTPVSPTETLI
ncbi:hypothetical protein F4809DRAFT_561731 [Biscogniauxia mediterranea]|nr:hypothetical protein F5X96DRAFT_130330 [Biscogniauxia mediterranea]KAI1640107.1 hypothetical protein F4809DRAFT_561731 [Biscogniauxia mediterranea]